MATEHHPPQHGSEGYERSDADVHSLFRFGVSLALLIALVMWSMVHTYNFFAKRESLGPPASPFENQRQLPPPPHLQPQPAGDLKRYCQIEEQQLTTYGWVDQQNGVVRIPVDRAMEMVLQKGLPARPAEAAESSVTKVGSATEPQAMGVAGPCGYIVQEAKQPEESKRGKSE